MSRLPNSVLGTYPPTRVPASCTATTQHQQLVNPVCRQLTSPHFNNKQQEKGTLAEWSKAPCSGFILLRGLVIGEGSNPSGVILFAGFSCCPTPFTEQSTSCEWRSRSFSVLASGVFLVSSFLWLTFLRPLSAYIPLAWWGVRGTLEIASNCFCHTVSFFAILRNILFCTLSMDSRVTLQYYNFHR
ncbi:hypothetical protein M431DRAFT_336511 [Trichoderma harzianum CBS 226.95]|uniref:Uncharacterized protein n=1 Tax=Trichoderma harzianum CBS 226.95 TaxID=983964 RepID=A0A2T4AJK6_TRIHA|nr:hypothetical protein M431DRAFT_336511 [Trichoderma harzianum CBS 226.95]PTB57265.1 hypothetical protein M431DRAFT_336511 [Trichoderma harzianum CBS 226.95]